MMPTRLHLRTTGLALALAMLCIGFLAAVPSRTYGYDSSPFIYDGSIETVLAQGFRSTSPVILDNRDLAQGLSSVHELPDYRYATNTAGQRMFRAVEPDELADLAGSGAFRTAPGLEGKYFWPTRSQADDFAAMASKANMGGPCCVASGCIPANVLRQIEAVPMDGLGPAYFIPEEYLPLIDDILIHGG